MLNTARTIQILIDANPYRIEDLAPEDVEQAWEMVKEQVEDRVNERVNAFVAVHTGDYGEDSVQVIGEEDPQDEIEFGQWVVREIEDAVNAVADKFEIVY